MITQRFNTPSSWRSRTSGNLAFLGFLEFITTLSDLVDTESKMIEIGSYMGESTLIFSSTGLFTQIFAIDPFSITEELSELIKKEDNKYSSYNNFDMSILVQREFKTNTRFFNNIRLLKEYSYNTVDSFVDNSIDFIYIDAEHTYEAVKQDLELYLPKLKDGGIIGGHDYHTERWPGVVKAVNEILGEPDFVFDDTSWLKVC